MLVVLSAALFYGSAILLGGGSRLALLIIPPVLGFLLPALMWTRARGAAAAALPSTWPRLPFLLVGLALLAGGSLAALALAGLLIHAKGAPAEERALRGLVSSWPIPLGLLVFAGLPALCEETLFRGAFLACLRPWGRHAACLTSGLLFAAFHGSLIRFLPVALLGFALAEAVWSTGNLWVAVAGHALHNAAIVLAASSGGTAPAPATPSLIVALGLGLTLLAAGLASESRVTKGR